MKKVINTIVITITIIVSFIAIGYMSIMNVKDNIAEATVVPTTSLTNNGIYYLRNQRSGKYLDVSGNYGTNGTNVMQYTYTGNDNQRFKLLQISTNVYEIIPMHAQNMRLDINGASTSDDANVQIYESNNTSAQRFTIIPTGNNEGAFKILTGCTNYQKCITVAGASYEDANVIQYGYGNNGTQDNDHWYFEDVTLNERIEVSLSAGTTSTYHITVPDDRFYVVETSRKYNNYDTTLYVSGLTCGTLYDDNSGTGSFSQVCFNSQGGRDIAITVGFAAPNTSGVFYLQIRKQRAVFYGFDYSLNDPSDTLNTIPDLTTPSNKMSSYFNCSRYESQYSTHFTTYDTNGYSRYNSELVFFSGHGYKNSTNSYYGTGVEFQNNTSFMIPSIYDMSNVRLVVWSACYSSRSDNNYNTSMIAKSVAQGARCAFGFRESVSATSAKSFTNNMFKKLADGYTVQAAANYASNQLVWIWDECKQYDIAGDSSLVLTTPYYTKSINEQSLYTTSEMNAMLYALKHDTNYVRYEIESGARYYLLINGCLSNHYIDIQTDENENIISVTGDVQDLNQSNKFVSLPIQIKASNKENVVAQHIVYIEQNDVFVPVIIEKIEYACNNFVSYDMICTNLFDGSEIDYETICSKNND